MFCPNCEAEYRDGFTRCSDCDVALVEHLGEIHSNSPELSNTPELLWTGTDPRMIADIKDALEVWSGEDPTVRNNLIACLNGIGIGSDTEDFNGRLRIRVTPSSQKRAREMIRQVLAAT